MDEKVAAAIQRHKRFLFKASILTRALVATLLVGTTYFPVFDSSPALLLPPPFKSIWERWTSTLLRWDAIHYVHIGEHNYYAYEHERAFLLGTPEIMKVGYSALKAIWDLEDITSIRLLLLGGSIISMSFDSTAAVYDLTFHYFESPSMAYLTALLSLIPPSPAVLKHAVYAEPFFAYTCYEGMIFCVKKKWLAAAVMFFFSGMLRSNGVMYAGFLIYEMLVGPALQRKQVSVVAMLHCFSLVCFIALPFAWHQYIAYQDFCTDMIASSSTWCSKPLPFIYSHVQAKYWNVGFLKYWTVQQLPNFLISAPVLILLFYASVSTLIQTLPCIMGQRRFKWSKSLFLDDPFLHMDIVPHSLHALIFTSMLFFAAHTQIILRLSSSMPFAYWSAAALYISHPRWGQLYAGWSFIWGTLTIILWGSFLPPA